MTNVPPGLSCSISAGDQGRGSGDHDRVVGCVLGPAETAIVGAHLDVAVTESAQAFARLLGEFFHDLQRDPFHQIGQDGGLIARTGADFQHHVIGAGRTSSVIRATM